MGWLKKKKKKKRKIGSLLSLDWGRSGFLRGRYEKRTTEDPVPRIVIRRLSRSSLSFLPPLRCWPSAAEPQAPAPGPGAMRGSRPGGAAPASLARSSSCGFHAMIWYDLLKFHPVFPPSPHGFPPFKARGLAGRRQRIIRVGSASPPSEQPGGGCPAPATGPREVID